MDPRGRSGGESTVVAGADPWDRKGEYQWQMPTQIQEADRRGRSRGGSMGSLGQIPVDARGGSTGCIPQADPRGRSHHWSGGITGAHPGSDPELVRRLSFVGSGQDVSGLVHGVQLVEPRKSRPPNARVTNGIGTLMKVKSSLNFTFQAHLASATGFW